MSETHSESKRAKWQTGEASERSGAQRKRPKRAIVLGGGGPVAGLHIGVLEYLQRQGVTFDVWALSCIGAWVGIVYNTRPGDAPTETYEFFRKNVFRADNSYSRFPINRVFGPDWQKNNLAQLAFLFDPATYANLLPKFSELEQSWSRTQAQFSDVSKWNQGDFNEWILNDVLAINPVARFCASLMYLSPSNGLSRIYYEDSGFLKDLHIETLRDKAAYIYHNAWDLTAQTLRLFSNKHVDGRDYCDITPGSLCACSALPFVESTVELPDGHTYCEGALVDTVNFQNLLEDHFDLDEIWISRIVDSSQVRKPMNLHDSLANLCELFAATVGEDDIKLFRYHLELDDIAVRGRPGRHKWKGVVVEIPVSAQVTYRWDHDNLKAGRDHGLEKAEMMYEKYLDYMRGNPPDELKFIAVEPGDRRKAAAPTHSSTGERGSALSSALRRRKAPKLTPAL